MSSEPTTGYCVQLKAGARVTPFPARDAHLPHLTSHALNRRTFLRQTVAFSALAATRSGAAWAEPAGSRAPPPNPTNPHMLLLGDWGADRYPQQQSAVAEAMKQFVDTKGVHPEAQFLLGDN